MGHKRDVGISKFGWVQRQTMKVKATAAISTALILVIIMKLVFKRLDYLYVAAESVHAAGIFVLIFKLAQKKTCSGLSLKSQELTAIFLAARLYCSSLVFDVDIYTYLDFATLVFTIWVVYMMHFKLKSTYNKEFDTFPLYKMVIPCLVLSIFVHPNHYHYIGRSAWSFCVFIESVSVLPQLRMMQNAKMVEPFTANYVFALGIARFLGFAHWILRVIETKGKIIYIAGRVWPPVAFLAEIIQTFILADFCYYYIKSYMEGQILVQLPV